MAITASGALLALAAAGALSASALGPAKAGAQLAAAPKGDSLEALLRAALADEIGYVSGVRRAREESASLARR